MKNSWCRALLLLSAFPLVGSGCTGGLVHRAGLDASGTVAVVSVVLPRLDGASPDGNRAVLAAAADHAAAQVRSSLAGLHRWEVQVPRKGQQAKLLQTLGMPTDADLAALFPKAEEQARVREVLAAERIAWDERFVGAPGLAAVPREALLPDEERAQKDAAVRAVMLRQAAALCAALQVDAVAFAHLRLAVAHPRSAFIVTDGRTDGMASLSATLAVVDKSGKVIIDAGLRPLDERSRKRDLLPLYRGSGKDAVKDENIDLADPKKKVPQALAVLIDEALSDLMIDLATAVGK